MPTRLRLRDGALFVVDEHPGYPWRQCLQDAAVGDELILVSHDPFGTESPYRSASPIFLHRTSCQPYVIEPVLPEQLTRRQLSVRSFDREEMMIDAAVIDGTDLELTIHRFFADTDSNQINVHNATRGCWAVAVDRAPYFTIGTCVFYGGRLNVPRSDRQLGIGHGKNRRATWPSIDASQFRCRTSFATG